MALGQQRSQSADQPCRSARCRCRGGRRPASSGRRGTRRPALRCPAAARSCFAAGSRRGSFRRRTRPPCRRRQRHMGHAAIPGGIVRHERLPLRQLHEPAAGVLCKPVRAGTKRRAGRPVPETQSRRARRGTPPDCACRSRRTRPTSSRSCVGGMRPQLSTGGRTCRCCCGAT